MARVFEKIIFKHIYNHLRVNFILSESQSGFLPGKSTVTQLLEIYDLFSKALDNNKEVRVIFLDISKLLTKFGTNESYIN